MSYIEEQSVETEVLNTAEETVEPAEQILDEADFGEVSYSMAVEPKVKTKKKFPLQGSIIVALCVVLFTVIAYLALMLFVPTIEGTWVLEGENGMKTYFTFDETSDGGVIEESIGTISVSGTFTTTKGEEADTLVMNLGTGQPVTCNFKVEGNKLFGERTLTLTESTTGSELVLNATDKPEIEDYLTPYENYKVNEDLLGDWILDYGMGQAAKLTIGEDGIITVDWFGTQTETGFYTVEGDTVKRKIFYDKEYEDVLDFELSDKGLVILQQLWTRADEATPDQK